MIRTSSLVRTIFLTFLTFSPALARAQDDSGPPDGAAGEQAFHGPLAHMLKKLGLSDAQKASIEALRLKYEPQFKTLGQSLKAEHEVMGTLMLSHPALAQATAEHKKMQALMNQMDDLRFTMFYDVGGVLTADQRTQWQQKMKEMGERHHRHHGPKDDGDGPGDDK